MKRWLTELFSVFSRLLNVASGGSADLTLSARAHRDGLWIERVIDALFRLFGERDHCRNWWEWEVERSRANVEHHDRAAG